MRAKQLAAKQWLDGLGLLPVFQEVELRVEVRLEDPVEHLLRLLFWSFFWGGGYILKKMYGRECQIYGGFWGACLFHRLFYL